MKLITIPISHYCERIRWTFEYIGLPYEEVQHLQAFHYRHVKPYGGRTVPVLVHDDGQALIDSSPIMQWADEQAPEDRKLYPADTEARAAMQAREQQLCDVFGVETRRVMYHHFFKWGRRALGFNAGQAPG
ncbi:MAG: glutathione S-transferase family protein [Bradymonadia bacterium]